MSDLLKQALSLPHTQRYFLAMRLLASLEKNLVEPGELTEEQLKELHLAKAEIEAGEATLFSREDLQAQIEEIRARRKKAS